jgi:hypothetical protein
MAHDRQLREPEQDDSTDSSKQPNISQDVVLNWLRLYAAMPYMREKAELEKWNWEEIILFYSDSLAKLKEPLVLHKAFQRCRDRVKFLPQPCEVLEAYNAILQGDSGNRPRYLDEPPLSAEEREAALNDPLYQDIKQKLTVLGKQKAL